MSIRLAYPWPHCSSGAHCTMGDPGDEACRCTCKRCRAARWGVTRSGACRRRWQWWAPWGVTDFWLPRAFRGSNEWCDDSVAFVVPPLGCLVVFWRPGPMRTMPCPEEWADMDEGQRADYGPCGRYHGGRINWAAHSHLDGPCGEAARWLQMARAT